MSIVQDAYDEFLNEMHDDNPGTLFVNYAGSMIMKEIDIIAYRCGLKDYSDSFPCVECGHEFSVEDPEESDGVCEECVEAEETDE